MMKYRKMAGCVMVLAAWMAACTEVDLCYSEHPHRSFVDFRFHWAEEYAADRPDSMRVVAIRPINFLRYEFITTAFPEGNTGQLLSPEEERQPLAGAGTDDGQSQASAGNDNLWLRSGEYDFSAFGWDTSVFDYLGLQADGEALSHIYLSYRHYSADSPEVASRYKEWVDYNPYSEYVEESGSPTIYYAYTGNVDIPVVGENASAVGVDFTPESMTQIVSFVFHLEKTPGVVVDSLVAEIAGVPSTIELVTGVLSGDRTYKIFFEPDYPALPTLADSTEAVSLRCEGTVNVTGIVRSYSDQMLTGPGILQVAVYAHCEEDGRRAVKVFHAGINLYHSLAETELLDWDDEAGGYRQTLKSAVIEIEEALKIDKDRVINDGSTSTGLDYWVPGETIEVVV